MKVREIGSVFLLGVILVAAVIGVSAKYWTKHHDSVVEEMTETFIEDQIEKALNLKDDALKDKIDFSYGSKEH